MARSKQSFDMSQRGKINQIRKAYKDFIQSTALKGKLDMEGNFIGTRKITGYVAAIHEDGELAGTIDVQEFNYDLDDVEVNEFEDIGYHEGVKLGATQINDCGFLIVPLMFSEVVIVQNPSNNEEYVIGWSHAKMIQMKSHEDIHIGVVEHEDFNESEDGLEKDFDELEETGYKAITDYTAAKIRDEVSVQGEGLVEEKTAEKKTITVGETTITIDGSSVTIETNGNVTFKVGGTTIEEKDGTVDIKTDTANIKTSTTNIEADTANIKTTTSNIEGSTITVKGSNVEITGGNLKTKGIAAPDGNGPFNPIKVCPFSGAPHCGSMVSGT